MTFIVTTIFQKFSKFCWNRRYFLEMILIRKKLSTPNSHHHLFRKRKNRLFVSLLVKQSLLTGNQVCKIVWHCFLKENWQKIQNLIFVKRRLLRAGFYCFRDIVKNWNLTNLDAATTFIFFKRSKRLLSRIRYISQTFLITSKFSDINCFIANRSRSLRLLCF